MAKNSKQKNKHQNFKGGDARGKELIKQGGKDLIGCQVEVYWDGEDDWYKGKISKMDENHVDKDSETGQMVSKPYHIIYQDGDEEWIDLKSEVWRIVEGGGDGKKRKAPTSSGANKKTRDDEEGGGQLSYDTQDFPRRTISKTEGVQVDEVFTDPFIYEVLIEIASEESGAPKFHDVKVRCGETCVVVDYKQPTEHKEDDGENKEESAGSSPVEVQRQVLVILPNKLDNNSANAFMSPNGRMKVQVKCRANEVQPAAKKE